MVLPRATVISISTIRHRIIFGLAAGALVALTNAPIAGAVLSQAFNASKTILPGSLVVQNKSGDIDLASLNNADELFGVAVPSITATPAPGSGAGQVQVATSGTADVFVTDAAGPVHTGDYLTVSPVAGVAQVAGSTNSRVIGTAQSNFYSSGAGTTKQAIPALGGKSRTVSIGQIPVVIAASNYTPTAGRAPYAVPNWIQSLANTLVGRSVSPLRVLVASILVLVSLVCITVLLYASVRNSLVSIGRNPLARASVLRGLLEVGAIVGALLIGTTIAVYIIIAL
jgi:hypothetical protein